MKTLLFYLLFAVVFTLSMAAPPVEGEPKKRLRPLHDGIMKRMKNIRESLMNKGQEDEYKRYWEELLANNPGIIHINLFLYLTGNKLRFTP